MKIEVEVKYLLQVDIHDDHYNSLNEENFDVTVDRVVRKYIKDAELKELKVTKEIEEQGNKIALQRRHELNGWKFEVVSSGRTIHIVNDQGIKYHAGITPDEKKIVISKNGTTRIVRFPKFVIDYVLTTMKVRTQLEDLYVINKSK